MTSKKQREANRRNALKSTGPKTIKGKAKSRKNAFKHGLTAEKIITLHEDAADFDALIDRLICELEPGSQMEQELSERIASVMWRLRRVPQIDAGLFTLRDNQLLEINRGEKSNDLPQVDLAKALLHDALYGDGFSKLSHYENFLMKQLERNLELFHKLKATRIERQNIIDEMAVLDGRSDAKIYKLTRAEDVPDVGF